MHPIKIDLMLDAKILKWNVRCSLISSILLADSGCNKTGLHKYFHLYHFVWQCNTIYHVNKVTSNILIYINILYLCIYQSMYIEERYTRPHLHPANHPAIHPAIAGPQGGSCVSSPGLTIEIYGNL